MNNQPQTLWLSRRWEVLHRDNFTCQYCGQFSPNVLLHVDHRVARVDGGNDAIENLVTACGACNIGKEAFRTISSRIRNGGRRRTGHSLKQSVIFYLTEHGKATSTVIAKETGHNRVNVVKILRTGEVAVMVEKIGREVFYGLA